MKRLVQRLLRRAGYDLVPFPTFQGMPVPHRPWEDDPAFLEVYRDSLALTLLDRRRLFTLYQCGLAAARRPGHFAECGVYQGGSARLLARIKRADQTLHLFDTFAGMPDTDAARDLHRGGDFKDTTLPAVQRALEGFPGVECHPGLFPATAAGLENASFSLVHLDFDIYQSMADGCAFFYPRLVPGGCIVIDDYGFPSCPGAKEAVDEFCEAHDAPLHYLMTGQALLYNFRSSP